MSSNILELCAARLYPSPINHLGFTMCLTESYHDIPQRYLVEGCALEHGIDFDKLNECASEEDGAVGMGMLRESVGWSSSVSLIFIYLLIFWRVCCVGGKGLRCYRKFACLGKEIC